MALQEQYRVSMAAAAIALVTSTTADVWNYRARSDIVENYSLD